MPENRSCVIQDDAIAIAEKMRTADVIAFATPIYYYEMSGQMKTLLDRANSLFSSKYAFHDIYLLTAAAENEETAADGAINGLQGWICLLYTSNKQKNPLYRRVCAFVWNYTAGSVYLILTELFHGNRNPNTCLASAFL